MGVMDTLEGADFPEEEVTLCMKQSLDSKVRELITEKMKLLQAKAKNRMAAPEEIRINEIDGELEGLKDQMVAHSLTLRFRGISKTEYSVMQRKAGTPRKDVVGDQHNGYNVDVFFENLIKRCVYEVVASDGDTETFDETQWATFIEAVNDAQWDELAAAASNVNRKATNPTSAGLNFGRLPQSTGK